MRSTDAGLYYIHRIIAAVAGAAGYMSWSWSGWGGVSSGLYSTPGIVCPPGPTTTHFVVYSPAVDPWLEIDNSGSPIRCVINSLAGYS